MQNYSVIDIDGSFSDFTAEMLCELLGRFNEWQLISLLKNYTLIVCDVLVPVNFLESLNLLKTFENVYACKRKQEQHEIQKLHRLECRYAKSLRKKSPT